MDNDLEERLIGGGGSDEIFGGPGEDFYSSSESIDYVAPDCENLNNID